MLGRIIFISFLIGAVNSVAHYGYQDCILVDIETSFDISYELADGSWNETTLKLAPSTQTEGQCGDKGTRPQMKVVYDKEVELYQGLDSLAFEFEEDQSESVVMRVTVSYSPQAFRPPGKSATGSAGIKIKVGKSSQSYECHSAQSFSLSANVTMDVSYLKAQGFNVTSKHFSDSVYRCAADRSTSTQAPTTTTAMETTTMPSNMTTTMPSNVTTTMPSNMTTIMPGNMTTTTAMETTTMPSNMTTTMPSNMTTTMPSNMTTTMPSNMTTTMHSNMTTTMPSNMTTTMPSNMTTTMPSNMTTTMPSNMTTTMHSNMTTTSKMTTTTTMVSTTTFAPNNTYVVEGKNHTKCLVLEAEMKFKIFDEVLTVPASGQLKTKDGSCMNTSDSLRLSWENKLAQMDVVMMFDKGTDGNFTLNTINVTYTLFNESSTNKTVSGASANSDLKYLSTGVSNYYLCNSMRNYTLDNNVTLMMENVRLQSFRTSNTTEFSGSVNDCDYKPPAAKTSAIVPIAVGAALAAMVVIVLIGYCIGRRRARPGYQAMS